MSFENEIMNDGRTVESTLSHLIAKHMPSAAVASEWVSPVDVTEMVNAAVSAHPPEAVRAWTLANGADGMCSLGLPWVKDYCTAHGLPTSDVFAKPFRVELMKASMRAESAKLARL